MRRVSRATVCLLDALRVALPPPPAGEASVRLRAADGASFPLQRAAAVQSDYLRDWIQDTDPAEGAEMPISNFGGPLVGCVAVLAEALADAV